MHLCRINLAERYNAPMHAYFLSNEFRTKRVQHLAAGECEFGSDRSYWTETNQYLTRVGDKYSNRADVLVVLWPLSWSFIHQVNECLIKSPTNLKDLASYHITMHSHMTSLLSSWYSDLYGPSIKLYVDIYRTGTICNKQHARNINYRSPLLLNTLILGTTLQGLYQWEMLYT